MDIVRRVSTTESTVLITGESGTGKELLATEIHNHSFRRNAPFVVVDCGALVETLFESELFGHVKGSFTGAYETKHGRFEVANGGTIFLDEISNISLNIQAKLLRVIQEREMTRIGSTKPIKVDVRIIAATNENLAECVESGKIPGGPLLPFECSPHPHPSSPGPQGGYPAPTRPLYRQVQCESQKTHCTDFARSQENSDGIRMARQYPRIGEHN